MHGLLLESSSTPPTQWAAIALGALTIIYLTVIRPMRKNKQKDPLARTPSHSSLAQQRVVEREMNNLLVEYEEMIRRMTAQVDTRTAKLELILREADEKLAQLRAAVTGQAGSTAAGSNGAADTDPTKTGPTKTGAHTVSAATPATAKPNSAADAGGGSLFDPPTAGTDVPDSRHQEVYKLADRGRTTRQIAKQLNRQQGEIELILGLRTAKQ